MSNRYVRLGGRGRQEGGAGKASFASSSSSAWIPWMLMKLVQEEGEDHGGGNGVAPYSHTHMKNNHFPPSSSHSSSYYYYHHFILSCVSYPVVVGHEGGSCPSGHK